MAQSTLALGYPDLQKIVGRMLGFDPVPANWTTEETNAVDEIINAGTRGFYFPPAIQNEEPHQWTFLHVTTTLSTVAADFDYDMPDNFGAIEGQFTYAVNTGRGHIDIVDEEQIRALRQYGDVSGNPRYAAFRAKSSDGTGGQKTEVLFYPTPTGVFVLTYKFTVLQNAVRTANPYPLGGMAHAETWKAFVLSEAEAYLNDEEGVWSKRKVAQLAASVRFDKMAISPEKLGKNLDRSDRGSRAGIVDINTVLVNGATP